jgi:hypothetical protein
MPERFDLPGSTEGADMGFHLSNYARLRLDSQLFISALSLDPEGEPSIPSAFWTNVEVVGRSLNSPESNFWRQAAIRTKHR